jgi:hypothetical protein
VLDRDNVFFYLGVLGDLCGERLSAAGNRILPIRLIRPIAV